MRLLKLTMFQLTNVMFIMLWLFMLNHIVSYYAMFYHVIAFYIMFYHDIACYIMLSQLSNQMNLQYHSPHTKPCFQIKFDLNSNPNIQLFKGRCWYLVNKLKEKIVKKKIRSTTEKADQKNQEQTWTVCPVAWYGHLVRGNPKKTDMWK